MTSTSGNQQKTVYGSDQSVLYGMADMHDRHRDMRLDIDNMSYEELLALEERIGNVNTRLTEENISKCMKQKIYVTEDGQPLNLVVYARLKQPGKYAAKVAI
ncbi:hypothetical protein Tco_0427605 [Tanacetum coccineum]